MSAKNRNLRTSTKEDAVDSGFVLSLIEALKCPEVQQILASSSAKADDIATKVEQKLSSRFQAMQKLISEKDKRITDLEKQVDHLNDKIDDLEQYSRRTSIRISGVPEEVNEDTMKITQDIILATKIDGNIPINRVHRVGRPRASGEEPRPILCQLVTYGAKYDLMKARKTLKTTKPGIFINEDLTRARASLLYKARQLKKKKMVRDAWSFDGKIAIKTLENVITPIRCNADLARFDGNTSQKTR